jgi:hypothetical protein
VSNWTTLFLEDGSTDVDLARVRNSVDAISGSLEVGEWYELDLCPGPYGCPFDDIGEAVAAGLDGHRCESCSRVLLCGGCKTQFWLE